MGCGWEGRMSEDGTTGDSRPENVLLRGQPLLRRDYEGRVEAARLRVGQWSLGEGEKLS